MEKKTIVINKTTHDLLKGYCDENIYKLNEYVDRLILSHLKEKNEKKKQTKKKLRCL